MVWDSPEQLFHEGGSETLLKAVQTAHAEGTHTAQPVCPPMIQSFPDRTPAGGGLATVGAPRRLHGAHGQDCPGGFWMQEAAGRPQDDRACQLAAPHCLPPAGVSPACGWVSGGGSVPGG